MSRTSVKIVGMSMAALAAFLVPAQAQAAGLCRPGAAVSVLWAGQWYPGRVLEGPAADGTCKIRYDGYGSNWDEWVAPRRLRAGAAKRAAPAPAPATRPAAAGGPPPGRYECYTFDSGQLNYTYTDVVIEAGGRYAVGRDRGSYTLAGDELHFTGPLSKAKGRHSVKSNGRSQIDLVFFGDNRASMACSRR